MKNVFISAKLVEPSLIRVHIFSSLEERKKDWLLCRDHRQLIKLSPRKKAELGDDILLDFHLDEELELGHSYFLINEFYGRIPLDVTSAVDFPSFEESYVDVDAILGVQYEEKKTTFSLWAPLSSGVSLLLDKGEGTVEYPLIRGEKGIYSLTLEGDLAYAKYRYRVINNEVASIVNDPYATGSTSNGKENVVIPWEKLPFVSKVKAEYFPSSLEEAIIYEAHVRDFTIEEGTSIKNKGKFLGMIEENCQSEDGESVGIDYLVNLGVTHIQLLPVLDYATVDEDHPSSSYNWGYDPAQFACLEGSYSSSPEDPLSRIQEFRKLVSAYHEKGIGVILDVVYNHVYCHPCSNLEQIVPGYYFRKNKDGSPMEVSGCGNDLATEKAMVAHLVRFACLHLISAYQIDGFRFDLMGIMESSLLQEIASLAKKANPSFLLYGEGWNMVSLPKISLANSKEWEKLTPIGYFNDFYRDHLFSLSEGFGINENIRDALLGRYLTKDNKGYHPSLSVNYLECHDGKTLFDKLERYPLPEKEGIVAFLNALVCFGFGASFFHMGQEIGLSKGGKDNTYNSGDFDNSFKPSQIKKRKWMYLELARAIKAKKSYWKIPSSEEGISYKKLDHAARIELNNGVFLLINPSPYHYEETYPKEVEVVYEYGNESVPYKEKTIRLKPYSLLLARI